VKMTRICWCTALINGSYGVCVDEFSLMITRQYESAFQERSESSYID
jgi:hypothetical protein